MIAPTRRALLCGCLLLLTATASPGQNPDAATQAEQALKEPGVFAIGGIGDSGATSQGEKALRVLLKQKGSSTIFRRLLKSAKPSGQLYALLGLRQSDRDTYTKEAPSYTNRTEKVKVMEGCELFESPVSDIARRIAAGEYDKYLAQPGR